MTTHQQARNTPIARGDCAFLDWKERDNGKVFRRCWCLLCALWRPVGQLFNSIIEQFDRAAARNPIRYVALWWAVEPTLSQVKHTHATGHVCKLGGHAMRVIEASQLRSAVRMEQQLAILVGCLRIVVSND